MLDGPLQIVLVAQGIAQIVVHIRKVRVDVEGLEVELDGPVHILLIAQKVAEVVEGGGMAGIDGESLAEVFAGPRHVPFFAQYVAQADVNVSVARAQIESLAELLVGSLHILVRKVSTAKIHVAAGVLRIDFDGLETVPDGPGDIIFLAQKKAKVEMGLEQVGVDIEGLAAVRDGRLQVSPVMKSMAKVDVGGTAQGTDGQRGPVAADFFHRVGGQPAQRVKDPEVARMIGQGFPQQLGACAPVLEPIGQRQQDVRRLCLQIDLVGQRLQFLRVSPDLPVAKFLAPGIGIHLVGDGKQPGTQVGVCFDEVCPAVEGRQIDQADRRLFDLGGDRGGVAIYHVHPGRGKDARELLHCQGRIPFSLDRGGRRQPGVVARFAERPILFSRRQVGLQRPQAFGQGRVDQLGAPRRQRRRAASSPALCSRRVATDRCR